MQVTEPGHMVPFTSWGQLVVFMIAVGMVVNWLWKFIREKRTNGHHTPVYGYQQAVQLAETIKARTDALDEKVMREVRDKIMANIDTTRHVVNGNLQTTRDALVEVIEKQTEMLANKLDTVNRSIVEAAMRRRERDR